MSYLIFTVLWQIVIDVEFFIKLTYDAEFPKRLCITCRYFSCVRCYYLTKSLFYLLKLLCVVCNELAAFSDVILAQQFGMDNESNATFVTPLVERLTQITWK